MKHKLNIYTFLKKLALISLLLYSLAPSTMSLAILCGAASRSKASPAAAAAAVTTTMHPSSQHSRCIHAPIRRIANRLALTSFSAPDHQSPAVTTVLSLERSTYAHRDAATRGRNLSEPTEGIAHDIQQRIQAAKYNNVCKHSCSGRTCFRSCISAL